MWLVKQRRLLKLSMTAGVAFSSALGRCSSQRYGACGQLGATSVCVRVVGRGGAVGCGELDVEAEVGGMSWVVGAEVATLVVVEVRVVGRWWW